MKYLLAIPILLTLIAALYPKRIKVTPKITHSKIEEQKVFQPTEYVTSINTSKQMPVQFHVEEFREERPEIEFDPAWEDDLYEFLVDTDPENADRIFKEYIDEKYKHAADIEMNLAEGLRGLSHLNGESGMEDDTDEEAERKPASLAMLKISHQERLRKILGENLEPVLTQYELHRQRNEEETEVSSH